LIVRTVTFVIPISEQPANALQLVFAQRRGPLEIVGTRPKARRIALEGRTLLIVFQQPAQAGYGVSMNLSIDGEAVRIVDRQQQLLSEDRLADEEAEPKALGFTPVETPTSQIFQWRDTRTVGSEFALEKRFFNEMDRRTWDTDPDQDEVLQQLDLMFAKRHANDLPAAAALELGVDPVKLLKFSNVFRDCIQAVFGDPATHVFEVEDAFERFARGELSLLDGTDSPTDMAFVEYKARACQPDSVLYMYFAELASACIRKNIAGVPWLDLLPALVHTQLAFAETYCGPGGNPIPKGELLGGKWPPAVPKPSDEIHLLRANFKATTAGVLDAVRVNYAQQFVEL